MLPCIWRMAPIRPHDGWFARPPLPVLRYPLENVENWEGTIVEVRLPSPSRPGAGRRSVREFAFAGMWRDRADMADRLEYVNRLERRPAGLSPARVLDRLGWLV